jgi:hypothetical protein
MSTLLYANYLHSVVCKLHVGPDFTRMFNGSPALRVSRFPPGMNLRGGCGEMGAGSGENNYIGLYFDPIQIATGMEFKGGISAIQYGGECKNTKRNVS